MPHPTPTPQLRGCRSRYTASLCLPHRLANLLESDDDDEKERLLTSILAEFGSHLATQAVIGGTYSVECHITASKDESSGENRNAVANALNASASLGVSAAGLMGAGTLGVSSNLEVKNTKAKELLEKHEKYAKRINTNQYITGGISGSVTDWLNAMRSSNALWKVRATPSSREHPAAALLLVCPPWI